MHWVRSTLFLIAYYVISFLYVVLATTTILLPGRKATGWIVRRYATRMVQALRLVAGIKLRVLGIQNVPDKCILAAKHHSWFDGFCTYSQFDDVAFVTGDHLEKIPLLRNVLYKLGAIVVNNCGGHEARNSLAQNAAKAMDEGRKILIYPEGHLSAVGTYHRYRTGVWHMYKDSGYPVVPVATNLGVFAPQQGFRKYAGRATIEFLQPIQPGLTREEFMERLERVIEGRSNELISEATGMPVTDSTLHVPPLSFTEVVRQLT